MSARVLIVDDNESLRRVFSALLTQAGYQVVAALPDGNGLLAWIKRETPDIVCADPLSLNPKSGCVESGNRPCWR